MTFLRTVSVFLACAPLLAAAPSAPTAEDASRVVAKIVAAYEKGDPVDAAVTKEELTVLETAPVASRAQAALYRGIPAALGRARAVQLVRTPQVPICPEISAPDKDPNGCVMSAARAAARDLGIMDRARWDSAASLYLALYLGPKNATPAELAAAQERAAKAMADPRVSEQSAARMRRIMAQSGLLAASVEPGMSAVADPAPSAGAGPGYRGVNAAIEEARRTARARSVPVRAAEVPSWSERLSASARDDESILDRAKDDGTVGTAVGRSVTQVKKTGSELLSYFVSGETWRRTAGGAIAMVVNPGETVRYLPGALKEAGGALWNGLKADIRNASDEVGHFIEQPTPYRGVAMVGSIGLAVSNAFVGGGAKTAIRQGAKTEIVQGARQAERLSGNLIGALDDLDYTMLAVPKKSEYQTAAREWKAKAPDGQFRVEAGELKGRIGVNQSVYDEVETVGVQRGRDCARFGITSCAIANGTPMTKSRVEEAAAAVMKEDAARDVARLEGRLSALRFEKRPTADIEKALAEARNQLILAEVGMTKEYGLSFDAIGSTLRELGTPHRSLGIDHNVLASLKRGEVSSSVLAVQRKIDTELLRGNAVMAALYTGSEGAHAQHAVTILGRGRDAAGRIVYEIYDSNVGRVAQIPSEAVHPYGAVVIGRL